MISRQTPVGEVKGVLYQGLERLVLEVRRAGIRQSTTNSGGDLHVPGGLCTIM